MEAKIVENNISAGGGEQDHHACAAESAEKWPGSLLHKLLPQQCKMLDLLPTMQADLLYTMEVKLTRDLI